VQLFKRLINFRLYLKKNNTINAKIIFFGFKINNDYLRDFRKKMRNLFFSIIYTGFYQLSAGCISTAIAG